MPADFLDYGKQFLIFAHLERSIGKHAKKEKIHHGFSLLLGHTKRSSIKSPNGDPPSPYPLPHESSPMSYGGQAAFEDYGAPSLI
jgi:hypothetical protein